MEIEKTKNDMPNSEFEPEQALDQFDDSITTVCFTGHRRIPDDKKKAVASMLADILLRLYERGARVFKAGGAVGFDTMAAHAVFDLRVKMNDPSVRLELCLAAPDQADKFSRYDAIIFNMIRENSDAVSYASDKSNTKSYYARNRTLVDGSDVCVAYCTKNKGGSYYTCTYALTHGVEFINVADFIDIN